MARFLRFYSLLYELELVKAVVDAFVLHEFFVVSGFYDSASFEDYDFVGSADGGDAVGDYDYGAAGHQIGERFLDEHFGFGVEM